METKEQCKNCEIINADCEGCKEFNKNIRNSDSETKEQRIRKLRKIIEKKELIEVLEKEKEYIKSGLAEYNIQQKIDKAKQELKELEDDTRN